jgi:diacylglycerol kinase (ATP)
MEPQEVNDSIGKPGGAGLVRIWRALGYSLAGLRAAWSHEAAFRQEVWVSLVLVPLGLWLGDGGVERALLVGSLLLVLVVELVNSAIEAAVDRHGAERHALSGRAKDAGSAAVLIAIVMACMTWLLVLVG